MLHIILLILKILGIVLLVVLGLLLLAVCAVLFVPVTWSVRAKKEERTEVRAVAGWLCRILSVHYRMDLADGLEQRLQVRLFGIPIFRIPGEDNPRENRKKKRSRKKGDPEEHPKEPPERTREPEAEKKQEPQASARVGLLEQEPPEPGPEPKGAEPSEREAPETKAEPEAAEPSEQDAPGQTAGPEEAFTAPDHAGQKKRAGRRSLRSKIRGVFRKAGYAIRAVCDKIKQMREMLFHFKDVIRGLLDKKDAFLEFWRLEEHVRAREAIWRELRYLWKKSRPKKLKGYVRFGFEDPSTTGACMGAASMLYAWYPENFFLKPDFEQEILEGELLMKGRIRGIVFLCIALRTLWNKDIRHMYRDGKQLIGGSS